jgi:hypothetical protein
VATKALAWSGLKGGTIGVGFDDAHFGLQQMKTEIDLAGRGLPGPARRGAERYEVRVR